jgi:hypothetical protein
MAPDEELLIRIAELVEHNDQLSRLNRAAEYTDQFVDLRQIVADYRNSVSWRVTQPLRAIGRLLKWLRNLRLVLKSEGYTTMKRSSKWNKTRHQLVTSAEPTKRDNLLEALRSRIAQSAAYFHPFEIGSVPFRIPAGMICSNYTDEETGTGYISLANGKTDAASTGATEGYGIRLPDTIEAAASGRRVSVNVVARAAGGAQSRFALAYSTNDVGNSGWRWQDAGPEWSVFTMEYDVPVMKNGNGDFVGILPDTEGRSSTEFCYLSVNTTEDHGH